MEEKFDVLAVGAGYAGAVAARALADQGKRVLVLERRDHIGGNAYDRPGSPFSLIEFFQLEITSFTVNVSI